MRHCITISVTVSIAFLHGAAVTTQQKTIGQVMAEAVVISNTPSENNEKNKQIVFHLQDEKLIDVVNRIAALKKINIVAPQGDTKFTEIKVNFRMPYKISLEKAWEMTVSMLRVAGYSVVPKKNFTAIVATTAINSEAAPIYINEPLDLLPKTDMAIRYVYYFENINLSDQSSNSKANLTTILTDLLPQTAQQNFLLEDSYNYLLITSSARTIRDIVGIIKELDQTGFREAALIMPLQFANAVDVVAIMNKLIPGGEQQDPFRFPVFNQNKSDTSKSYFADSTRLVAIERTNSIAIMGLKDSVAKARDFVQKYLDKAIDSERITIHVKPLQYLKSEDLAQVLTNLISQQGQSQSTGDASTVATVLKGVIVVAEKNQGAAEAGGQQLQDTHPELGAQITTQNTNKGATIGGNNLIIGARERDWHIIERMIDELDTLQRQVALEVLVVNLTVSATKQLGAQLRGVAAGQLPYDTKWQSAQLGQGGSLPAVVVNTLPGGTLDSAKGLDADLLQPVTSNGTTQNMASNASIGSTIFTFKDQNGIASVLQVLSNFTDATVISQPYVITTNHKQADISIISSRVVEGSSDPQSTGGPIIVNNDKIFAALTVNILPRISNDGTNINLGIIVRVNDFSDNNPNTNNNTIIKRTVQTNANMLDKQVLVLGGLASMTVTQSATETPLFGRIPIIGNLFKNQLRNYNNQSIMIFICPTIINPRLGGGANEFTTKKYLGARNTELEQANIFHNLRDPITKYFFSPRVDADMIRSGDAYMDRGTYGTGAGYEPNQMQGSNEQESLKNDDIVAIKNVLKDLKENPLDKAAGS
ncbi:hypothetical protein M1466_00070 [Candidatus Dependentiae bacterium]|nr:hypothetical protein [Candidatus Dependentiae bacterium]